MLLNGPLVSVHRTQQCVENWTENVHCDLFFFCARVLRILRSLDYELINRIWNYSLGLHPMCEKMNIWYFAPISVIDDTVILEYFPKLSYFQIQIIVIKSNVFCRMSLFIHALVTGSWRQRPHTVQMIHQLTSCWIIDRWTPSFR